MGVASGVAAALARTSPPVDAVPTTGAARPDPRAAAHRPRAPSRAHARSTWLTAVEPRPALAAGLRFRALLLLSRGSGGCAGAATAGPGTARRSGSPGSCCCSGSRTARSTSTSGTCSASHMLGHMLLSMAVPVLLVLSAPITLALRTIRKRDDGSRGAREWIMLAVHSRVAAVLTHPLVAGGLFAASLWVFYYSPLFRWATEDHVGHTWMVLHFLITGLPVRADPGRHRPDRGPAAVSPAPAPAAGDDGDARVLRALARHRDGPAAVRLVRRDGSHLGAVAARRSAGGRRDRVERRRDPDGGAGDPGRGSVEPQRRAGRDIAAIARPIATAMRSSPPTTPCSRSRASPGGRSASLPRGPSVTAIVFPSIGAGVGHLEHHVLVERRHAAVEERLHVDDEVRGPRRGPGDPGAELRPGFDLAARDTRRSTTPDRRPRGSRWPGRTGSRSGTAPAASVQSSRCARTSSSRAGAKAGAGLHVDGRDPAPLRPRRRAPIASGARRKAVSWPNTYEPGTRTA